MHSIASIDKLVLDFGMLMPHFTKIRLHSISGDRCGLGLHPLRGEEPTDLYELFRLRYETGSMIITSNRAVEEWYPLFGDDLLASAAMDRLLHHARVIVMEGHSNRNPPKKAPSKKAA